MPIALPALALLISGMFVVTLLAALSAGRNETPRSAYRSGAGFFTAPLIEK